MSKVLVSVKTNGVEINLPKSLKKAKKVKKQLDHMINKETLILVNIAKKQEEVEKAIAVCKDRIVAHHKAAVKEARQYNDSVARNFLDLQHREEENVKSLETSLDALKDKYNTGVETIRKLNVLFDNVCTDIECYESAIANHKYTALIDKTKPVTVKSTTVSTRVPSPTKEIPERKYMENMAIARVTKDLAAIKKVAKGSEDPEVAALRE